MNIDAAAALALVADLYRQLTAEQAAHAQTREQAAREIAEIRQALADLQATDPPT